MKQVQAVQEHQAYLVGQAQHEAALAAHEADAALVQEQHEAELVAHKEKEAAYAEAVALHGEEAAPGIVGEPTPPPAEPAIAPLPPVPVPPAAYKVSEIEGPPGVVVEIGTVNGPVRAVAGVQVALTAPGAEYPAFVVRKDDLAAYWQEVK